jgi:hypothetical protein
MLPEELGFAETSRAPGEVEITGEDIARLHGIETVIQSLAMNYKSVVDERREKDRNRHMKRSFETDLITCLRS